MGHLSHRARDNYEEAAKVLIKAVRQDYPIGVRVSFQRDTKRWRGIVEGHVDSWWSNPGYVLVRVRNGRKLHRVHFLHLKVEPEDKGSIDA